MLRHATAFRSVHEPVRVLHLVPRLMLGGMEQGVVKLLNGLEPERIVSGVCSFGPTDSITERLRPGISVHVLERRDGNDPKLAWQLIRLLRREKPHVVHSHSWGTLCEGYLATRLARIPHFVHGEHGTMELRPRNIRVQRWVWNRADRVLSVSSALADRMSRHVGVASSRVQVIRNGADLDKFGTVPRSAARLSLGISDDEFVVGTVGRLVPVKAHDTLLAALAHLKSMRVRCVAVIAGDGPLRDELEARVDDLGLRPMVRFLGTRNDIDRVLAALDVFALTSLSEGLPNTVLEAMAAGLPVISTDVGGVRELVDHDRTGLLVPSQDARAIADALAMFAGDPERRRRMGAEGLRKARADFALRRMLHDYERLYLELVGRPVSCDP